MFIRIGVFYVLTWFFLMLLGGIQQMTGLLPSWITIAQWGPGIAALLMLVIFRKDGHKITFFSKTTPVLRYLYAALIPAGVGLVMLLIRSWVPMASSTPSAAYESLWPVILWTPIGALGEEIGWRGYLHKKLDPRLRGLFSSLLVGVMWMPIHISFYAEGPVFLFFLLLTIISYSVVIYALVQDTGFNVLLATIFHISTNLANLLFLDVIHELSFMVVNGIAWTVVAAVFILTKKDAFLGRKSYQ